MMWLILPDEDETNQKVDAPSDGHAVKPDCADDGGLSDKAGCDVELPTAIHPRSDTL